MRKITFFYKHHNTYIIISYNTYIVHNTSFHYIIYFGERVIYLSFATCRATDCHNNLLLAVIKGLKRYSNPAALPKAQQTEYISKILNTVVIYIYTKNCSKMSKHQPILLHIVSKNQYLNYFLKHLLIYIYKYILGCFTF